MTTGDPGPVPAIKPDLKPGIEMVRGASRGAVSWLRHAAWPTWLEHGVDWDRRGFHEALDLATLACPAGFRRLRVAARQVFVFAEAARAGLPRAAEAAELGLGFLARMALGDDGGYARRFDLDGRVLDRSRDLYDHAFVLLALASAAAILPTAALHRRALALLRYLDTRMAHPLGGYVEGLPLPTVAAPRRQNPHMHLLEAFLAAAEAFGDEIFLLRAGDMVRLFLGRLFDARRGLLPEHYDEALRPICVDGRYGVEPGHHCEWVWLLDWHGRSGGSALRDSCLRAGQQLLGAVDRHGINPALGTAYDEIWSDGRAKVDSSRLWPQTERLKAEILRADATPAGMLRAYAALGRYLRPDGLWLERLQADGAPVAQPAPASSLYHLTSGLLVADRHLAAMRG